MNAHTLKTLALQLTVAVATQLPLTSAFAHGDGPDGDVNQQMLLLEARKATAPFTNLQAALAAGYVKFPDLQGDCVAQEGQGGMGIHYLNEPLLQDPTLEPLRPEMLVYRKTPKGRDELVALEYIVPAPVWDSTHAQPPMLFGHPFHLLRTPNRYGVTVPLYTLHVWLWLPNANGLFNDWNPAVTCD